MTAIGWIVFGVPAMLTVTFVAGRLLGARQGEVIGHFGLATAAALVFRVVAGVVRDGET